MENQTLEQFIANELKNEAKQLGRKINPESNRQKRLMELNEKREAGLLKKGRPINGESARQVRLLELNEKREAGVLKKGRPVNGESNRQTSISSSQGKVLASPTNCATIKNTNIPGNIFSKVNS
jgi:hypothetical protein